MKATYRIRNDRLVTRAAANVYDESKVWSRHAEIVTRYASMLFVAIVMAAISIAMYFGLR